MFDIPDIGKKKPKAAYKKPEAVRELERLANAAARLKYTFIECLNTLHPVNFLDNTSNGLNCLRGCVCHTLQRFCQSRLN